MTRLDSLAPLLVVDAIEPCLPFWCDRAGFVRTAEVPHEGRLGFVILEKDGHTLMLQSRASVEQDLPAALEGAGHGHLFLVVEDLAEIEKAFAGVDAAMPRRTTFYGMAEVGYRDPAGTFVVFAQQLAEPVDQA
jgi:uncharacterized glyoxalase superfamily protein PhnB